MAVPHLSVEECLYDVQHFITCFTNEWICPLNIWELLTDQYDPSEHSLSITVLAVSRIMRVQLFSFNLFLST